MTEREHCIAAVKAFAEGESGLGYEVEAVDEGWLDCRDEWWLKRRTLVELLERERAEVRAKAEAETRRCLWLAHGHDGIYGDDGEMQCALCGVDYKRDELRSVLVAATRARAEKAERERDEARGLVGACPCGECTARRAEAKP